MTPYLIRPRTAIVEHLITITRERQLYTIEFSCRRDYNLSGMWSSFNFIPKLERKGRSKEGHPLTVWQLEHECPPLIKILVEQKISSKIKVALDANIFFDFINDDRESKESKYLLDDWLLEEVELCLTDEIFVEIDRNQDSYSRESARKYVNNFTFLPSSDIQIIHSSLGQIFPEPETEQDKSDLRQLARAIASEAKFFITRDGSLLDRESQIYEEFKIQVLRPTDLIIELYKSFNNFEYQPVRLAGTTIEKYRVEQGDYNQIIDRFLMTNLQEKKRNFKADLHDFLARPDRYDCFLAKENSETNDLQKENNSIAFWIFDWQASNYLHIPILRIKNNLKNANVILKHLIKIFFLEAANNNRELTKITDKYLDPIIIQALREDLFLQSAENGEWIKPHLVFAGTIDELSQKIKDSASFLDRENPIESHSLDFLTERSIENPEMAMYIERLFYPAKIIDANIPNFIIPIQARWAEHLFDSDLADQTLFGARKDLAFNREAVYYRSARNQAGLSAPSHVLWYVSHDKAYVRTQMLRACSRVDEIVIDKPEELYRRFRRLGIYKLEDILKIVRGNQEANVMAICLSDTALFKNSIPLKKVHEIINNNFSFQSPYQISQDSFKMLYNIGMNADS